MTAGWISCKVLALVEVLGSCYCNVKSKLTGSDMAELNLVWTFRFEKALWTQETTTGKKSICFGVFVCCKIKPLSNLLCFCASAGTTMCFTTCWPEPVKRRGSPSICSNLRNTTTSTRSAHTNTHWHVYVHECSKLHIKRKINESLYTNSTSDMYVILLCFLSDYYTHISAIMKERKQRKQDYND